MAMNPPLILLWYLLVGCGCLGLGVVRADPRDVTEEVTCQDDWVRVHRGCYIFEETDELDWEQSKQHCIDLGGELAVIQSLNEKMELQKYITTTNSGVRKWYIGLNRTSPTSTDWRWLDDTEFNLNFLRWAVPAHATRPGVVCGALELTPNNALDLAVIRCDRPQSFICEYHSITPRGSSPMTTPQHVDMVSSSTSSESQTHQSSITSTPVNEVSVLPGVVSSTPASEARASTQVVSSTTLNEINTHPQVVSSSSTPETSTRSEIISSTTLTKQIDEISSPSSNTIFIAPQSSTALPARSSTTDKGLLTTSTNSDLPSSTTNKETDAKQPEDRSSGGTTRTVASPVEDTTLHKSHNTGTSRVTSTVKSFPKLSTATTTSGTSPTTQSATRAPDPPVPTQVDWARAMDEFQGCYIPATGNSLRELVQAARTVYRPGLGGCPPVTAGNLNWTAVPANQTARVRCTTGDGFATFHCGSQPPCWRNQPDTTGCASRQVQNLLKTVELLESVGLDRQDNVSTSMQVSRELASLTQGHQTSMEDVLVIARIMTSLGHVTDQNQVKDTEQVQEMLTNVVSTSSSLVSVNNSAMWQHLSQSDKVRTASTLLLALEEVTVTAAAEIQEPTVFTQTNQDMEVELQVLDVNTLESAHVTAIAYDSDNSDSSFFIPVENLKTSSKGGLATAVFITHFSMTALLGGRTQTASGSSHRAFNSSQELGGFKPGQAEPSDSGPSLVSYILSASLGQGGGKLSKPVWFTIKHTQEIGNKYITLCSFWNISDHSHSQGFWSQDGCRLLRSNRTHTTCECDHLTNFAILLDVHGFEAPKLHKSLLRLVTIIGCIVSSMSLLASWITFQCLSSLQGERNTIHKNLALTLLLAELIFVFGIDQTQHPIVCSVIAGTLHFLFTAAFTWMFLEGLHIIFMLVQVFDAKRSRLPYYYLTGYGTPLVVVGASCLFFYRGYGTSNYCWLTTERYFIWAFAGPVAVILLVNAFFLTYAMYAVCRHSDYVFNAKDKSSGSGIRSWVQGALAMEVLLGLTWTLGYFIIDSDSLPLAYIFAILNSLQGLFIFIFHCLLNKKAQKEYRQVMKAAVKRSPSSATTHSTLTKRASHSHDHSHEHNHDLSHNYQKLNGHIPAV